MECPKCKNSNPPDARFCDDCGFPLERLCPECRQAIAPTAKFCTNCGHDLSPVPLPSQSTSPTSTAPEGERRQATVPFSDRSGFTAVPDRTLEIPMRLLSRTVKQTRDALAQLATGQVLAVHTDDP